ncbi:RcnB family protein [Sphingorhabdus arenilitoris]|uniref:RcnB family protein n=1 Tax=Sphingorhabdus arenilitoris TaxID=1490041 RepID=A0ABV8RC56_9SPHN
MKKHIIALLAAATVLTPVAVQAKTTPQELRRDVREIREEKQDLRQAKRYGTRAEIRDARSEVREARQEYREDKQDYRRQVNRANYRAARFNAPFRYNSWNTGVRMSSQYYGSRYIVNNHASQRLPAPGYNQRYIRHYNDLLLVNIRSGHVVRVYRGFYW